ncbi:MAG: hypothetical protein WA324_22700 [Bryobacteraceae bacterium]
MMKHPLYIIYALLILGLTGFAEYSGWSMTKPNELRNIPRSIRDNPGAYRSSYFGGFGGSGHYFGGK